MVITRVIRAPRPATIALLVRRVAKEARAQVTDRHFDAVGLIQTDLPNLFYYADVGQKAGNVVAVEILGNCPQHVSTVAFFGSNEAVDATMEAIVAAEKRRATGF
jgi:BMC domain.